jgi:hypothetical protein
MARCVYDDFASGVLQSCWRPWTVGGGTMEIRPGALRLSLEQTSGEVYADAQISDYTGLPRHDFPWRPPLRMEVRAHASGDARSLAGTAGFGFWNEPFVPGRHEVPRLPRAVWFFFGGRRSNMALALDQPGNGWKAATFDAGNPLFWALVPLALPGLLVMRIPVAYRKLWPLGQRALGVAEAALPAELLAEPHDYQIIWEADRVRFAVDGRTVLTTNRSPHGPLGFVAWIDNQYAVVTPQGQFGWGVTASKEQWLTLERIRIEDR